MTGSGGTYLTVLAGCLVLSGAISLGIRFADRKTKLPDRYRDGQSPTKLASVAIIVSFICLVPLSTSQQHLAKLSESQRSLLPYQSRDPDPRLAYKATN